MNKKILILIAFSLLIFIVSCNNSLTTLQPTTLDVTTDELITTNNPTTIPTTQTPTTEISTSYIESVVGEVSLPEEVENNFYLPFEIDGVTVTYTVEENNFLSISQEITLYESDYAYEVQIVRPTFEEGDQVVQINAVFSYNSEQLNERYDITITAFPASVYLNQDLDLIEDSYIIENDFSLPLLSYAEYSSITISSEISPYLTYSNELFTVTRPENDILGTIVLEVSYGDETSNVTINITMKKALQVVEGSTLIISEYVEGSSFNKYIELYNPTAETLDLSEYTLETYFNGNTTASGNFALSGSLASGNVIVIGNSGAALVTSDLIDNSAINFNGNDVIVLRYNGTIIDSIGQIGLDADYVKDMTIVRKSGITSGDTDPFDAYDLSEWDQYPIDTATYLGSHTS